MELDKVIVTAIGTGLIGFIWWFFFGKKSSDDKVKVTVGEVDIKVEGGYNPSVIKIPKGISTSLNFKRTEDNSCLEEVIIPDFKVKEYLPLGKVVKVTLVPKKTGEFDMHCGMNMYHGKIIVE